MKTNVLTQMWGIFLIMSVCLLASCSENDTPALALTDPAEMYEPDLTFRGDALSLQINGTTVTDCSVYFEPKRHDRYRLFCIFRASERGLYANDDVYHELCPPTGKNLDKNHSGRRGSDIRGCSR